MDQAVHALFQLNKNAEVGEVANRSCMLGANRVFGKDVGPRIRNKLFDAERHLAGFAVQGEHNSLHLVAFLEEVLGGTQVL